MDQPATQRADRHGHQRGAVGIGGCDEEVELLLYAADGADLEVWVNGERLWRRGRHAGGGSACGVSALLHPGENEFGLRAKRRPGSRLRGSAWGIRGHLHWNVR